MRSRREPQRQKDGGRGSYARAEDKTKESKLAASHSARSRRQGAAGRKPKQNAMGKLAPHGQPGWREEPARDRSQGQTKERPQRNKKRSVFRSARRRKAGRSTARSDGVPAKGERQ